MTVPVQGPQGIQGPQGPQGIQGLQGQQGIQGIPGSGSSASQQNIAYVSLYSLKNQTIAPNASPLMEVTNSLSNPQDFDLTNAIVTGEVKVLKHGIYLVSWEFDGLLTPPFPSPVPAWSLAVYQNGAAVPATSSGSFSPSPDDICTHNAGTAIFEIKANDILKLVNTSTNSINGVSILNGSAPVASARLNIAMLQSMP